MFFRREDDALLSGVLDFPSGGSKPNPFLQKIGVRCLDTSERLERVLKQNGQRSEALATLKATEAYGNSAEVRRLLKKRLDLCDFDDTTLALVQEFANVRLKNIERAGGDATSALAIVYHEALEAVKELKQRCEKFDREHPLIVKIRKCTDEALTGGADDPVHESARKDRT